MKGRYMMNTKKTDLEFALQDAYSRERSALDYVAEVEHEVALMRRKIALEKPRNDDLVICYQELLDDLDNARKYHQNLQKERMSIEQEIQKHE